MYIYLDESGDLGFDFTKTKTTKKFVITLLVCDDQNVNKQTQKAIRRTLRKLNRRKRKSRRIEELKGTGTTLAVKEYFFRQLKTDGWHIYTLVLNKERVWPELQAKKAKPRLYNYLARQLIDKLPIRTTFTNVRLVVDRSKNIQEIQDFNRYVRNQIEALLPLNTGFAIEHLTSKESAGLRAVDCFAGAFFGSMSLEIMTGTGYTVAESGMRRNICRINTNKKSGPCNAGLILRFIANRWKAAPNAHCRYYPLNV